tara:strand:+ start:580 stop:807 length:228 start_codon:yes stop_codon:yes gene_type:complete
MIEIHKKDTIFIFECEKYKTYRYNQTLAKAKAFLLKKKLSQDIVDLYSNYYVEYIVNKCTYNTSIMNKLSHYGLL